LSMRDLPGIDGLTHRSQVELTTLRCGHRSVAAAVGDDVITGASELVVSSGLVVLLCSCDALKELGVGDALVASDHK